MSVQKTTKACKAYLSFICSSVKDLESDEDEQLPGKTASAAVLRSKQTPTALDHAKQKQQATPQAAKKETMPAPKSGKAELSRNDDSDWDEIR